jgi:hypothetical protein
MITVQPNPQEAVETTIATQATVWIPPDRSSAATGTTTRHGCGNGAPMEITNRLPQALGNLVQPARFPHFHKPPVLMYSEETAEKYPELNDVPNLSTGSDQAHGEAEWHKLGDTLAPKDFWKSVLAGRPGLRSLVIQGLREGSSAKSFLVKVEPSLVVPHGVYVDTNEHFVLPSDEGKSGPEGGPEGQSAVLRFLQIARDNWEASQAFALSVADQLLSSVR